MLQSLLQSLRAWYQRKVEGSAHRRKPNTNPQDQMPTGASPPYGTSAPSRDYYKEITHDTSSAIIAIDAIRRSKPAHGCDTIDEARSEIVATAIANIVAIHAAQMDEYYNEACQ